MDVLTVFLLLTFSRPPAGGSQLAWDLKGQLTPSRAACVTMASKLPPPAPGTIQFVNCWALGDKHV